MKAQIKICRNSVATLARMLSFSVIIFFLAGGLSGCVSGGGTDVGNALVDGRVTDGGLAVAGARVFLMPEGYDPVHGDTTGRVRWETADAQGRFALSDVKPGRYALEARHPSQARMSWNSEVVVEKGSRLTLNPSLGASRTLKILLPLDAAADAYVFIPTTDVQALRDSTGADTLALMKSPTEGIPTLGLGSKSGLTPTRYFQVSIPERSSDTLVVLE